jgi:hypothetical protein
MRSLLSVLLLLTIYFMPTGIACLRQHKEVKSIFVVNLFLGLTGIGWIVALAWSFSSHVWK